MPSPFDQIGLDFPQSYPSEKSKETVWDMENQKYMTKKEKKDALERKALMMFNALMENQQPQPEPPVLDPASQATLGRIAAADTLHGQKMGNIQSQADAASGVYGQMGQPLPAGLESRIASALSGGLRSKNPMLSAPMGPQSAAEVAPGQGAFVPGTTMSGRAGGAFVQAPLPGPGQAGLDRVAAAGGTGRQTGTYELSGKNRMVGTMTPEEVARKRAATAIAIKEMEQRMDARRGRAVSLPGTHDPQFDKLMNIISNRSSNQAKLAGKNPFSEGSGDDLISRARAIVASGGGTINMDQAISLVKESDDQKDSAAERDLKREILTTGAAQQGELTRLQMETEKTRQEQIKAQNEEATRAAKREAEKTLGDQTATIDQKRAAALLLNKPYKPTAVEIERESVSSMTPYGRSVLLDESGMVDPVKAREALANHVSGRRTLSDSDLAIAEKYAEPAERTYSEYFDSVGNNQNLKNLTPTQKERFRNAVNPWNSYSGSQR